MTSFLRHLNILGICLGLLASTVCHSSDKPFITVASTTSTEQSGLFKHLLPQFTQTTGIDVRVVAVGTGQAIEIGRRGDADVLLVHDRISEDKFVQEGFSNKRFDVMYNNFVLIGPVTDPAKVRGSAIIGALQKIAESQSSFVSRGDKSGTHAAELRLWAQSTVNPAASKPQWYRETGVGMGPALNTASGLDAYILSDRGTWLSFKNRANLTVLVEGDKQLFNPYGVMLVSPLKHPHIKAKDGQIFVDWLVSAQGQAAIRSFQVNGQSAFFGNAQAK